jgi:hypothetical protein
VHSRMRNEIWRIASSETADYPVSELSRCKCICPNAPIPDD